MPDFTGLLVRAEYRHDNSNQHGFSNNNFVTFSVIPGLPGVQHQWKGQDTLRGALIHVFLSDIYNRLHRLATIPQCLEPSGCLPLRLARRAV